ncbi:hypothetical protein M5K25_006552 [Dendrobium thyrsiflorum]|uniref:Uncharacterized protein n=1 Tax=Dendrobium thyrsiflorum TaxID=117978 RepID=A0ABD0VD60_DENTH
MSLRFSLLVLFSAGPVSPGLALRFLPCAGPWLAGPLVSSAGYSPPVLARWFPLLAAPTWLFSCLSSASSPEMDDPEVDHDFVYNANGQVNILKSPFFDFTPDEDQSVEEYVDRIILQLAATIDEQISFVQWLVDGNVKKATDDVNPPMQTNSSGDETFQVEEN